MARLFVAVWPPESVVEAVARAVDRTPRPGVRWLPPSSWHVTLRFLGSADPEEVTAALNRVGAVHADAVVGPVLRTLGRSVVVVPVAGLDELAGAVQAATAHLGQPLDDRPFTGHLTLARRKGRAAVPSGVPVVAAFPVDAFTLVRSETKPTGAEYRVLRAWALPPPVPTTDGGPPDGGTLPPPQRPRRPGPADH
jgi:2'-5' RNA ligase